jgi:mycothiol synthase
MSTALPQDVAGISWRPLTLDDVSVLHELVRAIEIVDEAPLVTSLDEIRQLMSDPDIELVDDSLGGFTADGGLACFGAAQLRGLAPGRRAASLAGGVHPDHRRRGLGRTVLHWSEERGRERLAGQRDEVPHFLEVWSYEQSDDRRRLFSASGFEPIRYYEEMRRPLDSSIPDLPLPAGLRLEAWSSQRDDAIRRAHNEAFTDHWGSSPLSRESWVQRFVGSPHFRPDLTWCVLDGDEVAAYCLSYHSPDDTQVAGLREAWLGQIGVRRAWRRRGLASALVCHVMRLMAQAGLERAGLQVDSDNPTGAGALYRRLGFVTSQREIRWAKPA